MAYFMVGHDTALFFTHDAVFLFFAHQDDFYGFEEVFLGYGLAAILYRKDGGLVDHIGEIGSYGSAGGQGDGVQVYGFVHFDVFGMDFQDVYAAFQVGSVYDDTAVKAART